MDVEQAMRLALEEAAAAADQGDVPIGAVILDAQGEVLARAGNRREADRDVSAHAEIVAMRRAGERRNLWRLDGCTMVVTLEPCAMCASAIVQARMARVVFATPDPKAGAVVSLFELCSDARMNHQVPWTSGLLREDAEVLLKGFFHGKRR